MLKAFLPALALVAVPMLSGAAPASAASGIAADLNGDGRIDQVSVRVVEGVPDQQELVAAVGNFTITARMPLYSHVDLQPLRVTDLDGDGRDEVVVHESLGANTVLLTAWGLSGFRLRPVTTTDGEPLVLAEGGGISALNGYGCEVVGGSRTLVTVSGRLLWDSDPLVYEGSRVVHSVHKGVSTVISTTAVTAERTDPAYQVDPQACA